MRWQDDPNSPLLMPWFGVYADPTLLTPAESPDGSWHMFSCDGVAINHWISSDGIRWKSFRNYHWLGYTQFIFPQDGEYYLFYQKHTPWGGELVARISRNLRSWSREIQILTPQLDWERRLWSCIRNPCVIHWRGRYQLYYSAGSKFLLDLGFCEPMHIGLALSDELLGPYQKLPSPIISPNPSNPHRSRASGGIKVYTWLGDLLIGFNNGIYADSWGRTRSGLLLLISQDGIHWKDLGPILLPHGYKQLIYQLDAKLIQDQIWLYYNFRDGWLMGREGIALSRCSWEEFRSELRIRSSALSLERSSLDLNSPIS